MAIHHILTHKNCWLRPSLGVGRIPRRKAGAFSLVEVTLALGIVAFAVIPILGLLPVGLDSFSSSMDRSIKSQISQRIITDLQQTDFDTLTQSQTGARQLAPRYFDNEGNELGSSVGAIYWVNVVVATDTPLPSGNPLDTLATVAIQVASNPGGKTMDANSSYAGSGGAGKLLWMAPDGMRIAGYSMVMARN